MAYDENRGRIVLFGGEGEGPVRTLGDTWEWDGPIPDPLAAA